MSEENLQTSKIITNPNLAKIDWINVVALADKALNDTDPHYTYSVRVYDHKNAPKDTIGENYNLNLPRKMYRIDFQQGNLQKVNSNGILDEVLLAIVQHRLGAFQDGEFKCVENEKALDAVNKALMWMLARRNNREAQNVLDTYQTHKS